MDKTKVRKMAVSAAVVASMVFGASLANAQDDARINETLKAVNTSNTNAKQSQQRIDSIASETDKLFGDYKQLLKVNAGLEAYIALQRKVIADQERRIAILEDSIGRIDEIKRQISPLMEGMVNDLESFINLDVPFQLEERRERVSLLRDTLENSRFSDPEKFRVILQAYDAEVSYGRSLNTYEGKNDDGQAVNYVRLGRIGFYYQDLQGASSSVWNNSTKSWEPVDESLNEAIRNLIRMAKKTKQYDITLLPVLAPAS